MAASFLIRAGAFTPASSLLDGSEADGTNIFPGTDAYVGVFDDLNGATITTGSALAPNGATDAAFFKENGATSEHIIFEVDTFTPDGTTRWSTYAKANGRRYLQMVLQHASGATSSAFANFDLQDGVVTDSGTNGSAQALSNVTMAAAVNGFYKCSMDIRLAADVPNGYFIFALSNLGTGTSPEERPSYAGDNTSGVYLWRPKLVQL